MSIFINTFDKRKTGGVGGGGAVDSVNGMTGDVTIGINDIPNLSQSLNEKIGEAPQDNKEYARKNGEWVEVVGGGGADIEPIPLDFIKGLF